MGSGSVQESWKGWFWFRVSHEVVIKMKAEVAASEGLTEVRKSVSEVPHSRGCWQETSGPQHVGLHSAA